MLLEREATDLPEEVTDYAFDQFPDRLSERQWEAELLANEGVVFNYDDQCVEVYETIVALVLKDAMHEKIRDIEREVERGERDDFTSAEVARMRNFVESFFE